MSLSVPAQKVKPMYTLRQYRDDAYKVCKFRGGGLDAYGAIRRTSDEDKTEHSGKFSQAFARARSRVLDYALSNEWDFFMTLTIDERKHDRFDCYGFLDDFAQWIRDYRKKTGRKVQFLIIPEYHLKGGVHAHGLISGIPENDLLEFSKVLFPVPRRLIDGGYLCWLSYSAKFGFCSLSPVRDAVSVSLYITKYLSKDFDTRSGDFGRHLYRASRGLSSSRIVAECIVPQPRLDALLVTRGEFVSTGLITVRQSSEELPVDWSFPYRFDGMEYPLEADLWPEAVPVLIGDDEIEPVLVQLEDYEQLCLEVSGYF